MILARTLAFGLAVFVGCDLSAQGHEVVCLPRPHALAVLQIQLDQQPLLHGTTEAGPVMELFWSEATEAWSIVVTDPDGEPALLSCRLLAGFKLRPRGLDPAPTQ